MAKKTKKRVFDSRVPRNIRASPLRARGLRARMAEDGLAPLELYLYDEIGGLGIWAEDVARELAPFGRVERLAVRINTPGGNLDQATAIMAVVSRAARHVTTSVDGAGLSAGSLIAQVGHEREISAGGVLMLHEPWGAPLGNAKALRAEADVLETLSRIAADAYAQRSGRTLEEIAALMTGADGADGTWFSPQDAVDAGFIDRVVPVVPASMAFEAAAVEGNPPDWAAALLSGSGDPRVPRVCAASPERVAGLDGRIGAAQAALSG